MAPQVSAGFKMTHTLDSRLAVSPKSAQQSIESHVMRAVGRKKGFFRPIFGDTPENAPVPRAWMLI
jgi:hypothetical protein